MRRASGPIRTGAQCPRAAAALLTLFGALGAGATAAAEPAVEPARIAAARAFAGDPGATGGWTVASGAFSSAGLLALGPERAAVRIALAPGWKTYWRLAGPVGLPPRTDWSGSENLAEARIRWPAAVAFESFGAIGIGYGGAPTFAIVARGVDPKRPIRLKLRFDYAVCREICVPESARFDLVLPNRAPAAPLHDAVRAAIAGAAKPTSAADRGLSAQCRLTGASAARSLSVRLTPAERLAAPALAVEGRRGARRVELGYGKMTVERDGEALRVSVPLRDGFEGPVRAHVFVREDGAPLHLKPIDCVEVAAAPTAAGAAPAKLQTARE